MSGRLAIRKLLTTITQDEIHRLKQQSGLDEPISARCPSWGQATKSSLKKEQSHA
jgi:hypothetical protein